MVVITEMPPEEEELVTVTVAAGGFIGGARFGPLEDTPLKGAAAKKKPPGAPAVASAGASTKDGRKPVSVTTRKAHGAPVDRHADAESCGVASAAAGLEQSAEQTEDEIAARANVKLLSKAIEAAAASPGAFPARDIRRR